MVVSKEMLEKVRKCESAEELMGLAKENNMEMTQKQAQEWLESNSKSDEVSEQDLKNVAGGGEAVEERLICSECNAVVITKPGKYGIISDLKECKNCGYSWCEAHMTTI